MTDLDNLPPGIKLKRTLEGHGGLVRSLAWSPNGQFIASTSGNSNTRVWNAQQGQLLATSPSTSWYNETLSWSYTDEVIACTVDRGVVRLWNWQTDEQRIVQHKFLYYGEHPLAWSPTGNSIATVVASGVVLLDPSTYKTRRLLKISGFISGLTWSPDGQKLVIISGSTSFGIWDTNSNKVLPDVFRFGHDGLGSRHVCSSWCGDGSTIAFGSSDGTITLYNPEKQMFERVLEGHSARVDELSWSSDGKLLASLSTDEMILWRSDTWEQVVKLDRIHTYASALAFHPTKPLLASSSLDRRHVCRIWEFDYDVLLPKPTKKVVEYTNAKVALVGDSGVGKSGLALVLTGKPYAKTDSTHGRHIWTFSNDIVPVSEEREQQRETLLWDFAGQPGYRVHHQLHLSEVAVALVIFDASNDSDPFAGVIYWAKALDEATKGFPLVKLLVAARTDRGTPFVSSQRINEIREKYGFAAYYETSAIRGVGVEDVVQAIRAAIAWDRILPISAPELFHNVKQFLTHEKESGDVLRTRASLLGRYRETVSPEASDAMIAACITRLEAAGLVRPLVFENWTLLQPELLDDYCAWIAQAARAQKDGLGYISEDETLRGRFPMDDDRPLVSQPSEERILLLAVVEELVTRQIAWRQETDEGVMLVFPSELRADMPDYPGSYSQVMRFLFEGPIRAIYATLSVCLLNSVTFQKHGLYRNAATFHGTRKQVCGFVVDYPEPSNDGLGRLTVFFDADTANDTKKLFLRYVHRQLEKLALKKSVRSERLYQCGNLDCSRRPIISRDIIEDARTDNQLRVFCPRCAAPILLDDLLEGTVQQDSMVKEIEMEAKENEQQQKRLVILPEKERLGQFDTFYCHNSKDKPEVRELSAKLRDQGILGWVDEEGILAGDQFVPSIEHMIDEVPTVLVLVGANWLGRWQQQEYFAFLQRFVEHREETGKSRLVVVPVLMPSAPDKPELPVFLRGFNWVDFRKSGFDDREAMRILVKGIVSRHQEYLR